MAFNNNITPGSAPLLWSNVQEAFIKINENFEEIVASTGLGITPVNFESLNTSVSPTLDNTHDLGSPTNKWGSVFASEWRNIPGDELNGLWAGSAQIKGIGNSVELPSGSTIAGELIIDPDKTFFKSVQIDNGNQIVASMFGDILNLVSGESIQLVVDSGADSITINNTGVTSITGGTAISVSQGTGDITINNTGVTSLVAGNPVTGRPAGAGVHVSNAHGDITITNTGLLGVQAGYGINITNDTETGISYISYNPTSAPTAGFTSVAVIGQSTIAADTTADTLNFSQGYGIILTTDEITDTLTITLNQNIDIKGSVFGDDSSTLVDGASNRIIGNVYNNIVHTNELRTAETEISIGYNSGVTNKGLNSVAIGSEAGNGSQGAASIAIGKRAGYLNQHANSIILNASGSELNSNGTGRLYINPIRSAAGTNYALHYNPSTSEVSYSDTLVVNNVKTSSIATSDSSALTISSPVNMLTGLTVGSDIIFADGQVQTIAYSGGAGRMLMIDTNRTDSYIAVGTADKPFKTVAAAMAACAIANPTGVLPYTFVLMGCTVSENVDFSPYNFNFITFATTCRSTITGTFTAGNSSLKQLVIRNIEFANTFTLLGDATAGQFANTSIYNASFSSTVTVTTVNNLAFYEAAFFGPVYFKNLNYIYINGAQFNADLTLTVDDSGATVVPANGISPMVVLGFNFIANNIYMTKVGGGATYIVFQPHMARFGTSGGNYAIPMNFIFQPQGCAVRGTWTNNGSVTTRNSSFDIAVRGTSPAYTGVLGGDRIVADSPPATSKGAAGDRVGMIAAGAGYLYVCTADWTNGIPDIWSRTAISATTW